MGLALKDETLTSIWEQYRHREASLDEMLRAYAAAGEATELAAVVQNEDERSVALFLLAELPTAVVRPIWRCTLPYVADPEIGNVLEALDVVHTFISEADEHDLLLVLRSVSLANPGVFAKLFAIMLSVRSNLLRRTCDIARDDAPGEHSAGLALLVTDFPHSAAEARRMLKSPDLVTRFYGCCLIGRHHRNESSLHRLLPARVRRRLLLHIEGEQLRQSLRSDRR